MQREVVASAFTSLAAQARPSAVKIALRGNGIGSGVIWDSNGRVITNAHVVQTRRLTVETHDGSSLPAELEMHDPKRDLALLRINGSGLRPAVPGPSERLRVGELVFAFGNPLGMTGALSSGIVHAIGPVSGLEYQNWIQAGIRLAPGNSGGPLLDTRGRVVGINSMIARGLGLAVPAAQVDRFLRGERDVEIGVTVQPHPIHVGSDTTLGLYVREVKPGSPAASAGVRPGDLLTGVSGRPFASPFDLLWAIQHSSSGLPLDLARAGRQISLNVPLRQ